MRSTSVKPSRSARHPLEHEHEDPVGRADGEQVDGDRGQRDRDRPEREHQEHEAQRQHEDDHDRQPAAVDREAVARLGGCAADEHAVRGLAERARDVFLAQPVDGGRRAFAGRFHAQRQGGHRDAGPDSIVNAPAAKARSLASSARRRVRPCCAAASFAGRSTAMVTGSVAPLGSRAPARADLAWRWWCSVARSSHRRPVRRSSTGEASASKTAVVAIRLIAGRRMTSRRRSTRSVPPRRPRPRSAARATAPAADRRDRRAPSAAPGGRSTRRGQGPTPTITAPSPRLRRRRVGDEQHREHGQRERGATEDHRARGGAGDGQDGLAFVPLPR